MGAPMRTVDSGRWGSVFLLLTALLIAFAAFTERASAQATHRFDRPLPPPQPMDPDLVREARNTLRLVLYKRQQKLFDHRYLSEEAFDELRRAAALSAADAAIMVAQLKESASLAPVEQNFAGQIRSLVTPTSQQLDAGLARLKAPSNVADVYTTLEKNNDVSRSVAQANIRVLEALQPLAQEDVRDSRLEREKALAHLFRERRDWQDQVARVKAGTVIDQTAVTQAKQRYFEQFEEVKKKTSELERLTASQQNLQSAIQMHQAFVGGFEQLEAASRGLKRVSLLAGDGSAVDQATALIESLDSLSTTALGQLESMQQLSQEVLTRDKQYIHDTLLAPRFSTSGGSTYLNEVLRRLPAEEAEAEALESMVSVARQASALASTVKQYLPDVKQGGLLMQNIWTEHNKVNPRADLQTAQTRNAIEYFRTLSEVLLGVPEFLERRGIAVSGPIGEILKYAGHTVGMLPLLVDHYSDNVLRYQQFVTLPPAALSAGTDSPFLRARHMYLHENLQLAAYTDLAGGDQQTIFVENDSTFGPSSWVRLTPDQFQEVLRAMTVFATLTGRNPTQDEFLTLCASRSSESVSYRVPTFHYFELDPDSPQYFSLREMRLSVSDLLGDTHREVIDNPRYADRYGGYCLALCEAWNAALANIRDPLDYRRLLATQTSLLGLGEVRAVDRETQLRYTEFSRRYAELNQLFRDAYGSDIPSSVLGGILVHDGLGRSPLEQQLLLRRVERIAASQYGIDVAATQPAYDRVEFLISPSAPHSSPPQTIETTLHVTLPGGHAVKNLTLSPLPGAPGQSMLRGRVDLPLETLATGGTIHYEATATFDGIAQSTSGTLKLQTLVKFAPPSVMPESPDHDAFEFSTVLYHHAGFQPTTSEMETRLKIAPLRRSGAAENGSAPQEIDGTFAFDRQWGDSLAVVRKLVTFDDPQRWPPGEYLASFIFRFGETELETDTTSFLVPEPEKETPQATDDVQQDEGEKESLSDPTGPLRIAAARAASLSSQIAASLESAHGTISEARASSASVELALAPLRQQIEQLTRRSGEVGQLLPGLRQSASRLEAFVLQVIEAKQRAKRAATQACDAAAQAAAAKTAEERDQHISTAQQAYVTAHTELDTARQHATDAMALSTKLKSVFEGVRNLQDGLLRLNRQLDELDEPLARAGQKLDDAEERLGLMRRKVEKLDALRKEAAGMLATGQAQLAPFEDEPLATTYAETLEALYGEVVAAADKSRGYPDAAQLLLESARTQRSQLVQAVAALRAEADGLPVPPVDALERLLESSVSVDVAEVWVLRAEAEVERARGCALAAAETPVPEATLDELDGIPLTRAPPTAPETPEATLGGLAQNPLTPVVPVAPPPTERPDEMPERPVESPDRIARTQPPPPAQRTPTPPVQPTEPPVADPGEQMEDQEHTYQLSIVSGRDGEQQPFPYRLRLTPSGENRATATLFIGQRLSPIEQAQLATTGLPSTMNLSATWDGQQYVIRGKGLESLAKFGAVLGIAIGEELGEAFGSALALGLLGGEDESSETSRRGPQVSVEDAVMDAKPDGQDLAIRTRAKVHLTVPNEPRKTFATDMRLIGKRID